MGMVFSFGWFLVFGRLVFSKCKAADLKHGHKVGLSIWLAAKISRLSFQGGSFKGRDALKDALQFKNMLRLVPCGHVCQHCEFCEQEPCTPGVARSCPNGQASQRRQTVLAVRAGCRHGQTCIPKACTAPLVPKASLCPGRLGRAGMLAGRDGSIAVSGTEATKRRSWHEHPSSLLWESTYSIVMPLQLHRPGPDFHSEDEKKILIFKYRHHFHGHLTL